eukprot:1362991-Amorphochlora_amoeboformis.AAC.1
MFDRTPQCERKQHEENDMAHGPCRSRKDRLSRVKTEMVGLRDSINVKSLEAWIGRLGLGLGLRVRVRAKRYLYRLAKDHLQTYYTIGEATAVGLPHNTG